MQTPFSDQPLPLLFLGFLQLFAMMLRALKFVASLKLDVSRRVGRDPGLECLSGLDGPTHNHHLGRVKTLTMEKFLHSPALAQSLQPGQSLVVTADGKAELIVTRARKRPHKTAAELRLEARHLLTKPGKKVDTVALLRELRK